MAIEFNEEKNTNISLNKNIILLLVLFLGVIAFLLFKNGTFCSKEEIVSSVEMFEPINIDFDFITSKEFKELENFKGIPVLPGFFEASDTETPAEKIEVGRENPFKEISLMEIEMAVIKVIEKIEEIDEIEEMRTLIQNSLLYGSAQKELFLQKLLEQEEYLSIEEEEEDIENENENNENENNEEEDYFKEW